MAAVADETGKCCAVQVIRMIIIIGVDGMSRKNGNNLADSLNGVQSKKKETG